MRQKVSMILRPLNPAFIVLPLVLMSLPLRLPNSLTQLLTILLLLPLGAVIVRMAVVRPLFLVIAFGTVLVSLLQVAINTQLEGSAYQAVRAGLPFFFICAIIASYRSILARLISFVLEDSERRYKFIDTAMMLFSAFAALQTLSFLAGVSFANTLSASENNRVMIFQTTSCILLLYYAILERKYFMIACLSIVVVGTGSKAIFVAALAAASIALVVRFDFAMVIRAVVAGALLGGALVYVNPVVIDRLSTFIENDDGEAFKDPTREFEIEQAKDTFLRSPINTVLGAGFAMQLSPGVPTYDPAWAENSKYDIENGYWGVLAKLGIMFSLLFLLLCVTRLPLTATTLVIFCIEVAMFFKTSYQIFCYMDGVCLLLWSLIVEVSLRRTDRPLVIARRAPSGISGRTTRDRRAPHDSGLKVGIGAFALPGAVACMILATAPRIALAEDSPPAWSLVRATEVIDFWDAPGAGLLLSPADPKKPDRGPSLLPQSIGWREYAVEIDRGGWFRLEIPGFRRAGEIGIAIDPTSGKSPESIVDEGLLDLGQWFWLDRGRHRLRFIQKSWSPSPQVSLAAAQLQSLRRGQAAAFRLTRRSANDGAYRLGACPAFVLQAGGTGRSFSIGMTVRRENGVVATSTLDVPASDRPSDVTVAALCDVAGDYVADFKPAGADPSGVAVSIDYAVFDTTRREPVFQTGPLVQALNPASRQPDYGPPTSTLVSKPEVAYREAGPTGMPGTGNPPLDWFGYRISGLTPGHGYFLEIEYPDDAPRAFVVALRDVAEDGYPPSIGINTGGVWPLSGHPRTVSVPFWARSGEARLLVFNYLSGLRAAVSGIRIYDMIEGDRAAKDAASDRRKAAFWYEEGERFRDLVGDNAKPQRTHAAVDRYLRLLASSGVDTLFQSAAVYGYQLFPSPFGDPVSADQLKLGGALLLGAERYGIKVSFELHPRSDRLLWGASPADLKRTLLLSATGETSLVGKKGTLNRPPLFSFLDPEIRKWYLDYISLVAATYSDRTAFSGIQIRMSDWRNSAVNNFSSLTWGYNAAITEKFYAETGIVPAPGVERSSDEPEAVRRRAEDILENHREQWIRWRCDQVAELVRDIAVSIRRARPDLSLSLNLIGLNGVSTAGTEAEQMAKLREAGVDMARLAAIDGVHVIDERWSHGPRTAKQASAGPDPALKPEQLYSPPVLNGQNGWVLWPMVYYEIRPGLWPGDAIGIPTKKISPWVSATMEPAGRYRLARYAALLATSDPFLIGDGGNNYAPVGDGLADFMQEFRSIPARPFRRVASTPASLAARCSERDCYFVSLVPTPQEVTVRAAGATEMRRLRDGEAAVLKDGTGSFRLDGFGLKAFTIAGSGALPSPQVTSMPVP